MGTSPRTEAFIGSVPGRFRFSGGFARGEVGLGFERSPGDFIGRDAAHGAAHVQKARGLNPLENLVVAGIDEYSRLEERTVPLVFPQVDPVRLVKDPCGIGEELERNPEFAFERSLLALVVDRNAEQFDAMVMELGVRALQLRKVRAAKRAPVAAKRDEYGDAIGLQSLAKVGFGLEFVALRHQKS
ncbi:MAG: hypothetical protein AAGA54_25605 [Myxococcota bacterium]